jgi:DNA processing protein
LLERFGSPEAVLQAKAEDLLSVPHFGTKIVKQLLDAWREQDTVLAQELAAVERAQVTVLGRTAPAFPARLRQLADSPIVLYQRGTRIPRDEWAISIVGSRQCTSYGESLAKRLAGGLARRGFTIVSGLARGIDGVAHRAALEAGGRTIAVLAGGLSNIYPPEHRKLADDIVAAGALVSESPMNLAALPDLFPRRNRLISGLSLGVVVVEAHARSGALITARHAAEQGREVFAVPGRIDSEASAGTLELIRSGAVLVRTVDDILERLDSLPKELVDAGGQSSADMTSAARESQTDAKAMPAVTSAQAAPMPPLSPAQQKLWDALSRPGMHQDELIQDTGLDSAEANSALLLLELTGLVRRLPGNRFERRRR